MTPSPIVEPEVLSFVADPGAILTGERSTLSWEVKSATTVTIENDEGVVVQVFQAEDALLGSLEVSPTRTTVFTLIAVNAPASGGQSSEITEEVTLTVNDPPLSPTVELEIDPMTVVLGEPATLSWKTTNTVSLSLTANGEAVELPEGDIAEGELEVSPSENTEFVMVATGEDDEVSAMVSLAVLVPPSIEAFTADPETINEGDSADLAWTTLEANRIEIRAGEEVLMTSGKDPLMDTLTVSPLETTTYTLLAENMAGTIEAEVTVTVRPAPAVLTFIADPVQIARGSASTLSWTTENADTVEIFEGDAEEALELGELTSESGSAQVSPEETTTFRLVATGAGGVAEAEVEVTVVDPVVIVNFEAEPALINLGESTTLRWETSGATSIALVEGDDEAVEVDEALVNGELQLTPLATTTYRLTATGPGGMATAEVEVSVDDSVRVSLTVEPEIIDEGGSTTLSWQTIAVDRIEVSAQPEGGESVAVDVLELSPQADILEVSPEQTTTYSLTGFGEGGEESASVTVQVNPAVEIVSFEADRELVIIGESATLSWEVANAASVTLSFGESVLDVDANSDFTAEDLQTDTAFTLTAEGVLGPVSETVTVRVREPVPPAINSFTASPETLDRDDEATLSWDVTGAETLTLTAEPEGGEVVSLDLGDLPLDVGQLGHVSGVSTTYTLTATNAEGSVDATAEVLVPLSILAFEAEPIQVIFGQNVALSWRVQAASSASLTIGEETTDAPFDADGFGAFVVEGVEASFTATLTVVAGEDDVEQSIDVELLAPEINSFTATPEDAGIDDEVAVAWDVTGAETLTLSATDDLGETVEIDLSEFDFEADELTLVPARTTTFTLSAENPSGSVEAQATVTVALEILEFVADNPQVDLGAEVTLSWRVQGAVRAELQVGEDEPIDVPLDEDGRGDFGFIGIDDSFTATLTAFDADDNQVSQSVDVELRAPEIVSFTVERDDGEGGPEVIVNWETTNAAEFEIVVEVEGLEPLALPLRDIDFNSGSARFRLVATSTFRLRISNNVAEVDATAFVELPVEILSFVANPNPVPFRGETSANFVVLGAITATMQIDDAEPVDVPMGIGGAGSFRLGAVTQEVTLTLRAFGPGGNEVATDTLDIEIQPPTIGAFLATPDQGLSGESYTLDWNTNGAETLTLTGQDSRGNNFAIDISDVEPVQGIIGLDVFLTTTYTLTATNPGGEVSETATITIENEPDPALIVSFEASPEIVLPFESSTLFWETTGVVSMDLERLDDNDQVVETIAIDPQLIDEGFFDVENLLETQRYRLVALGADNLSVTAEVSIVVDAPPIFVGLSEVYYDAPGGDDELEWIELFNDGPFPVNLNRVIVGYGGGSFAAQTARLPDLTIQPGECVVIGGPNSEDDNHNPELDALFHIDPNLQNSDSNGRADGVALFDANEGAVNGSSVPFDAVLYGDFVDDGDTFIAPFGEPTFDTDVADANSGQSIYRIFERRRLQDVEEGDEVVPNGVQPLFTRWEILNVPTPGRCFGMPPVNLVEGDDQVINGRRRGPELGGNNITLATFNAEAIRTEVLFGGVRAQCGDDFFFGGLSCVVPPGTGTVDLVLRQDDGDVVFPDFYTYEPIDFCNLQFPHDIEGEVGSEVTVFGRVFEDGVTQPPGASPDIVAEWGFGPFGTDPGLVPELWTWQSADFNGNCQDEACFNNDEYLSVVTLPDEGIYTHAYRFRFAQGDIFTYCDRNGTVNNNPVLGNLFSPDDAGTMSTFIPQ